MLTVRDLTFRFGGHVVFDGASATVPRGHKVGIVGQNGAGKSTLLRLISGAYEADIGSIEVQRGIRVGTVAQEMPDGPGSPLDFVLAADAELAALQDEAEKATDAARIAEIHGRLADIGAHAATARAASILAGLGFDEAAQQQPLTTYSGGWRMRIALAATLFAAPDLLLLDEPSNHLDLETRLWLESHLTRYAGTILLISHDRLLLNAVVGSILHVERGGLTMYRGDYDRFERTRRERLRLQAAEFTYQTAQRRKMQAFVDRFRYKASKARQAQSRLKAIERLVATPPPLPDAAVAFDFPAPEPLRPPLLTLDGVDVGYTPGTPVLEGLDLVIDGDDRIALVGANGNGKSTFLKLLEGGLQPFGGTIRRSAKLRVGYFEQEQAAAFDLESTPFRQMSSLMPDATPARIRGHLGRFGFTQDKANLRIGSLSGGEKAKLLFACITRSAPHILLLDEPTNHLDIDSREGLISALNAFDGAVILVSHDVHVVELCADRLWLVADGTCRRFDGDVAAYRDVLLARQREARRGARKSQDQAKTDRPSRKEARRAGAASRAARASLRTAVKTAERRLEDLQSEQMSVQAHLADPDLYNGGSDALVPLQKRAAALSAAIGEAEAAWLEAQLAAENAEPGPAPDGDVDSPEKAP